MTDTNQAPELLLCPWCKNPPAVRIGPPAMARCITNGCYAKTLAAIPVERWNRVCAEHEKEMQALTLPTPAERHVPQMREALIGRLIAFQDHFGINHAQMTWKRTTCDDGIEMVHHDGDTIFFGDANHKEPNDIARFDLIVDLANCVPALIAALTTERPSDVAVAFVPIHPRNGPLWSDTIPAGSATERSNNYPRMALYAIPHEEAVREALRAFAVHACYPVSTSINPRGYAWRGEDALDYAKQLADRALSPTVASERVSEREAGQEALRRLIEGVDLHFENHILAESLRRNVESLRKLLLSDEQVRAQTIEECVKLVQQYGLPYPNSPAYTVAAELAPRISALAHCGDGWFPIETVPIDGTPIILFIPMNRPERQILVCHFDGQWWICGGALVVGKPTKWRHRPPAPKEGA